ncbi:MAG: hypothetical protein H7Y39_01240 [Nitrospiraceae bacterium]|nr:hypothetical protein [Nitrospiraceae bacterium]
MIIYIQKRGVEVRFELFRKGRREIARSRCETGTLRDCQPKARRTSETAIEAEGLMNNAG